MALTTSYLSSTKNLESIFNSIIGAKAPERFTTKFLEDLGFKSSTDRLIIGMLKALGLLNESGQPTQRYYDFLDQTQSKKIIAIGIQEAYEDLFNLKKDAQSMSNDEIKNKLRTLTQGQKGDRVIEMMSTTFRALCGYADWVPTVSQIKIPSKQKHIEKHEANIEGNIEGNISVQQDQKINQISESQTKMNLHYNIQIHLPETSNMAVYDAIFQSLKKHLF